VTMPASDGNFSIGTPSNIGWAFLFVGETCI
jgi:hypothetical protein